MDRCIWRCDPSPQSNSRRSPPTRASRQAVARRAVGTEPPVPRNTTERSTPLRYPRSRPTRGRGAAWRGGRRSCAGRSPPAPQLDEPLSRGRAAESEHPDIQATRCAARAAGGVAAEAGPPHVTQVSKVISEDQRAHRSASAAIPSRPARSSTTRTCSSRRVSQSQRSRSAGGRTTTVPGRPRESASRRSQSRLSQPRRRGVTYRRSRITRPSGGPGRAAPCPAARRSQRRARRRPKRSGRPLTEGGQGKGAQTDPPKTIAGCRSSRPSTPPTQGERPQISAEEASRALPHRPSGILLPSVTPCKPTFVHDNGRPESAWGRRGERG